MNTLTKCVALTVLTMMPLTGNVWSTSDDTTTFYFVGTQSMLDELFVMAETEYNFEISFEEYESSPSDFCYPSYYTHYEPMIWQTCSGDYSSWIIGEVRVSNTPDVLVPLPVTVVLFSSVLLLMGFLRRKTRS